MAIASVLDGLIRRRWAMLVIGYLEVEPERIASKLLGTWRHQGVNVVRRVLRRRGLLGQLGLHLRLQFVQFALLAKIW